VVSTFAGLIVVTDLTHPFTTVGEHQAQAPAVGAVSTAAWVLEGERVKTLITNVASAIRRDRFMSEGYL
jgi:hypothetical protein